MSERFNATLEALGKQLGIELIAEAGIASLTLDGEQVIHLAPLGEDQLAMFARVQPLENEQQAVTLLQRNLFSEHCNHPRVGLSPDNHLIAWSQHALKDMDGAALYQALSTLLAFADALASTTPATEPVSPPASVRV